MEPCHTVAVPARRQVIGREPATERAHVGVQSGEVGHVDVCGSPFPYPLATSSGDVIRAECSERRGLKAMDCSALRRPQRPPDSRVEDPGGGPDAHHANCQAL